MARTKGSRGWGHIRQLPSGRFQASYIGPDRVRHTAPVTYTRKQRAEGWLADERKLIELDDWTPPAARSAVRSAGRITVSDYATTWIKQRPLKPRTRAGYSDMLRLHITPTPLGKTPIGALTPAAVRSWYSKLDSTYTTRNGHLYGLLHAVVATAVTDGLLTSNPCTLTRVMNPTRKREPVILTIPEIAALADKVPAKLKAAVLVSAWCGVRWGELIELRRKDVSEDCEVLSVRRAVTHRGQCRIDTPKSGKGRVVVIPPHIRADLTAHLDAVVADDPESLLFPPARTGCHFNDKVFREGIAPALESIGRQQLRIHDLRHFAGTQIARVGNLVESMQRLGHSTVKASMLYQSVVSDRDAEIAAALSELAVPSDPK